MKAIIATLLLVGSVTVQAQSTFTQYHATNFVFKSANNYVYTKSLIVESNAVARVVNFQYGPTITGFAVSLQYAGDSTVFTYDQPAAVLNLPVLGPATINFSVTNYTAVGNAYVLAQFDTVNLAPSSIGLVQPASKTATIALQTSTDLATWSNVTLTNFGAGAGNRFFRLALTNSP